MGRGRFKFFVPEVLPTGYTPAAKAPAIIDENKYKYVPPPLVDPASTASDVDVGKAQKRLSITNDYTISPEDHFVGVNTTGGSVTVTLPPTNSISEGKIYIIKDEGGASATNEITVRCADGARIDSLATIVLSSNYCAISIYFNAADWHIY